MKQELITEKHFTGENYREERLPKAEYELCTFDNCDFSSGYLDNTRFLECTFTDCDLSNANLSYSQFQEATFVRCKMMGLQFRDTDPFLLRISFEDCDLSMSSFYGLNLKGWIFIRCKLMGADFTESDLSSVRFEQCNLDKALFDQTVLHNTNFETAINYRLDPTHNKLKKTKFSRDGLPGLLHVYDIVVV